MGQNRNYPALVVRDCGIMQARKAPQPLAAKTALTLALVGLFVLFVHYQSREAFEI